MEIKTNKLNYDEIKALVSFIKELKKVDYSVIIESHKNSESFTISFNEV
jgi:ABC-type sugar transport system ATPase subunit